MAGLASSLWMPQNLSNDILQSQVLFCWLQLGLVHFSDLLSNFGTHRRVEGSTAILSGRCLEVLVELVFLFLARRVSGSPFVQGDESGQFITLLYGISHFGEQ